MFKLTLRYLSIKIIFKKYWFLLISAIFWFYFCLGCFGVAFLIPSMYPNGNNNNNDGRSPTLTPARRKRNQRGAPGKLKTRCPRSFLFLPHTLGIPSSIRVITHSFIHIPCEEWNKNMADDELRNLGIKSYRECSDEIIKWHCVWGVSLFLFLDSSGHT